MKPTVAKPASATTKPSRRDQLDAAQLGKALAPHLKGLEYMSEGDSPVTYVSVHDSAKKGLTPANVLELFKKELAKELDSTEPVVADILSAKASAKALAPSDDADDPDAPKWNAAFKLLQQHLTDVRFVKVGPQDEKGKLATDQGMYSVFIVGKTADGKIAGLHYTSVET